MGSREHSFLSPTSDPREQQSARELAEESKTALVDLEIILKRRTETLEQQIKDKHRETITLSREKEDVEHKLQDERLAYASKREQLWNEIEQGEMALECKNEAVQRLERRLGAQAREFAEDKRHLQRQLQDLQANITQTANKLIEKDAEAKSRQEQLQREVERLQEQLREQSAAFEQQRAQWTQQGTAAGGRDMRELKSSLLRAVPHLRSLLEACDRQLGDNDARPQHAGNKQVQAQEASLAGATVDLTQAGNDTPPPSGQEFNEERAQLLEQASDAARTQYDISLRNLAQREAVLTCPISLELFANPVVTTCCGKTFSSDGLRQALRRSSLCPFCRASDVLFCPNRDVAKLVELHRAERSVLGLPELPVPSSEEAEEQDARTTDASRFYPSRSPPSTRQSRLRDHRSERVHARSGVSRRQPTRQGVDATIVATVGSHRHRFSYVSRAGATEGDQSQRARSHQSGEQPPTLPTSTAAMADPSVSTTRGASTRNRRELVRSQTRESSDPRLIIPVRHSGLRFRFSYYSQAGADASGQSSRAEPQQSVDGRSDDVALAQLASQNGSASSLPPSQPASSQQWPSSTGRLAATSTTYMYDSSSSSSSSSSDSSSASSPGADPY
ncbi:hypothetical protein ON010_g2974 [Phytophthora cinnamomi]|nr:hypothetical protein ON010_g2974 [Phytophthora cinnamomi]